jgi:hypothetical protein
MQRVHGNTLTQFISIIRLQGRTACGWQRGEKSPQIGGKNAGFDLAAIFLFRADRLYSHWFNGAHLHYLFSGISIF